MTIDHPPIYLSTCPNPSPDIGDLMAGEVVVWSGRGKGFGLVPLIEAMWWEKRVRENSKMGDIQYSRHFDIQTRKLASNHMIY